MLGRSLGNYGVVSKIGEGGMGVVYLAQHVTLGKKAAIKVLRPALSSNQDIVSRFFNEARAVTAVRNPGIVDVYDFGFLEDRTAYIIMEYLDGESLATRLRRGRPAIPWTLTVVRAITRALHAAHEQGIVHRDLKPDNVFLVPDSELPGGERVKLLDFGIAKLAHGVGDASQTTTGTVMGTPTYMAPEQCRGAGSVDHRADLYSLGCVAYEMLCGQPPFVAEGPGDVIARHLYFEPASLRSQRSEIPVELEEIVLRLLKKEPRARYNTAADFVRAIDQLSGSPSPAAGPSKPLATEFVATLPVVKDTTLNGAASSSEVSRKTDSRSRFAIVAGAATFVAAFLGVIIFFRAHGDGETGSNPAAAALAAEQKGLQNPPVQATPVPPGSSPPPVAAGTVAPPAAGSPNPVNDTPRPVDVHPDGSSAAGVAPSAAAPTALPEAAAADPASSAASGGAPAAGDVSRRVAVASSAGAAVSGDVPRSDGAATSSAAPPPEPRKPPATKPAGHRKPRDGARSTAAPAPAEPPDPYAFPKWNKTLQPIGSGTATAMAKPSAPPGTPASPAAFAPSAPECTRASFAAVLDAKAPSQAAVKSALTVLGRCKSRMDPVLHDDIHRQLIDKS